MSTLSPKPVEFRFSEYLNKGFELFKKDMGTFILSFIFLMIMNLIPLCGFLGIGNFLKIARKINQGQEAKATEIFNFDDFMIYLKLYLIAIAAVIVMYIPLLIVLPQTHSQEVSTETPVWVLVFLVVFVFAIYYILLKAYYMISLISLEGVKSIRESWDISKIMTKGNLIMIFVYSLVVGIIGELGILACGVGLLFTLPLVYVLQYISYEDGIQQIKVDELQEIGKITE